MESYKKGKTMEEIYGIEKAEELKEGLRKRPYTWGDKIGKALRGKHHSKQSKKNMSLGRIGIKLSEECKIKMSKSAKKSINSGRFVKGHIPNNLNILHNPITWKKISNSLKGKMIGEKNHQWLGGKSFEPYTSQFNKEFKNLIKLRDNFCCLNCGISEQKHIILTKKKLPVHHIDYNKKNTCLYNCCALCLACNSIANKNRGQWKLYYQEKLSGIYGYKYELLEIMN